MWTIFDRAPRPSVSGERAHKTLQDRLLKELRLAGAATLAAGNALLSGFIADYSARFAEPPANAKNLHRPVRGRESGAPIWESSVASAQAAKA
jgi:hypothetical protein